MVILLWIVVAFLLALAIARYNESNKTFWILFISLLIGIAGGSVYSKLTQDTQSEPNSYEGVSPTQASPSQSDTCLLADLTTGTPTCYKPELVSQEYTPDAYGAKLTLVKGHVTVGLKPPRSAFEFFNTS